MISCFISHNAISKFFIHIRLKQYKQKTIPIKYELIMISKVAVE